MPFAISQLENGLIVSCQPVKGGAMDTAAMVVGFALAALDGGAVALRIESADYVRAVRRATDRPIIGLIKRDLDQSPVRITPFLEDVDALIEAGADIVAYDATDRTRPVETAALVARIHAGGRIAMADCSILADAERALMDGANRRQILVKVIAPLCRPAIVTGMIFGFITAWNEFLFGLMLTTSKAVPITVGASFFFAASGGGVQWGVASAVMVVGALPPVLLGLVMYRQISGSMTAGAVKG